MLTRFRKWSLNENIIGSYAGILICNVTVHKERADAFVLFVSEALQLIELYDPRRFRMVQREVHYIANRILIAGATYDRDLRVCSIDFSRCRYQPSTIEHHWHVALSASTIVHEATHGRLYSFGISYNRKTWERCERICRTEEKRFALHLKKISFDLLAYYDLSRLVPEFDRNDWKPYRGTARWRKVIKAFRRLPNSGRLREK